MILDELELPAQRKNASGPQEDVGASLRVVALPQAALVLGVVADPGRGVVVLGGEASSGLIHEPVMALEEAPEGSGLSDFGWFAPLRAGFDPLGGIESDRGSGLELPHARTRT